MQKFVINRKFDFQLVKTGYTIPNFVGVRSASYIRVRSQDKEMATTLHLLTDSQLYDIYLDQGARSLQVSGRPQATVPCV